jgi:hypothetical protein
MLKPYNGFSGKQRDEGDKIIKQAIKEGRLIPLTEAVCVMCGQDKGIRHYHCEDYSPENILNDAKCYCWRCHMIWHSRFKYPEQVKKYFDEIAAGKRFPPVYRHDFTILRLYHGIN